MIAGLALAALAGGQEPSRPPEPRIYWGAYIGSHLTGLEAPWDMDAVSAFEGMVGKPLSLVNFGMAFADCSEFPCTYYDFPEAVLERTRRYGAIPVLTWTSQGIPPRPDQPDFQLSDVIEGRHDAHIRRFAAAAKAWGKPFFLRFDHQMNSDEWAWSEGNNGNAPGEYVEAWRHVHGLFGELGVSNATWTWCPMATTDTGRLGGLYPGDAYVDWTCLDGYNIGFGPFVAGEWMTFGELFEPAYTEITANVAPAKPMLIGEVASSEYGASKAAWITDMLAVLPTDYPVVRGVVWLEKFGEELDWPIESSATSVVAFSRAIADPTYAANDYANLEATPIPAPG